MRPWSGGDLSVVWPERSQDTTQRSSVLLSGVLFALVIVTFYPVVHNDLINLDDPSYVALNSHVQQGLTWGSIRWAFTTVDAANWHPLTWLSHILDYQLFGEKVWGHHLTSLLLHSVNTLGLFLVLRRLTGSIWRSFFVAAFFGVHPLRVESVAWVAERKDVLSALFFLLTLFAYTQYARARPLPGSTQSGAKPAALPGNRSRLWYLATIISFALGLMSKPMVVTLPFVLLLLDFWPLQRLEFKGPLPDLKRNLELLWEKIPLFLLAILSCVATVIAQRAGGIVVSTGGIALALRAENAVVSYCRYLGKIFWPVHLAIFYPLPEHIPGGAVFGAAVFLLALSLAAIWLGRRAAYLPVGWWWFIGTLVPVIGLVQVGWQAMADRYTYVPSVGVFLFVIWGGTALTMRFSGGRPGSAVLLATLAGALLIGCVFLTRQQVAHWKDSETVLRHALAVTDDNAFVRDTLGLALRIQGRLEESNAEFRRAIQLNPQYAGAYRDLGNNLTRQHRLNEGIPLLETAIRLAPQLARTHKQLGVAYQEQGRLTEALTQFQEELRIAPNDPEAHNFLGAVLLAVGRSDEAAAEFHTALKLKPDYAEPHSNLGIALCRGGHLAEGIVEFEEAVKLKPDYAEGHNNLAVALARAGRKPEAIAHFKEALRLRPDYPGAEQQLRALGGGR